jgi:signal transduction histidine kinase/DNA-binding response OmpR family regulator/ligand-binding sensor domain-containing protein
MIPYCKGETYRGNKSVIEGGHFGINQLIFCPKVVDLCLKRSFCVICAVKPRTIRPMHSIFRLLLVLSFSAVSCCVSEAQTSNGEAGNLFPSTEFQLIKDQWSFRDGLPDWYGNSYLQDSKGFIWIHTNAGLITFDGLEFRSIPVEDSRPINRMGEDVHGNIWLVKPKVPGKSMEVDVLNPDDHSVQPLHRYIGLDKPIYISIENSLLHFHNRDGIIWIGGGKTCYRYDGTWKKVFDNPVLKNNQKNNKNHTWYPGPKESNWLPNGSGNIELLDAKGELLDSLDLEGRTIAHYWGDKRLGLWIAFYSNGNKDKIYYEYIEFIEGKIKRNANQSFPDFQWEANQFFQWETKKLLQFGIQLKTQSGKIIPQWERKNLFISPSMNLDIFSRAGIFFVDRSGNLWLSDTDGLFRFSLAPLNAFKTYLSDVGNRYSVRGMTEFNGKLYVLTYSGVRSLDTASGEIQEIYWPFNNLGLALIKYKDFLYVGSNTQYLVKYSDRAEISLVGQKNQFWSVNVLFDHPKLGLLAGTHQGIYTVNAPEMEFKNFALDDNSIFDFHLNKEGLWVLGSEGLSLVNLEGQIVKKFLKPGDPYNFEMATHLHEDSNGNFWVSTRGSGLIFLDPKTGNTKKFDTGNGFSHFNIHAVYADKSGCLWLPSDNGLMRFDPVRNKLRTYYENDGIAENEFNRLSHYRAKDGRFFFGGINGITAFYPEQIPWDSISYPEIKVTSCRSFLLKKGIYAYQSHHPDQDRIFILKPSDAFLEISLSPFLFEDKKDYSYRWKIDRVQEQWVEQSSNIIRLNSIPYGHQKLLVQFKRNGNTWSDKSLIVPVQVIYPFYLKWPFLISLAAFIFLFGYFIIRLRTRNLLRDNAILELEVIQRTAQVEENLAVMAADRELIRSQAEELKSIDELKTRFFTNVTHELRTPLTLILGPVEVLINKHLSTENDATLHIVRENARKLLRLVEELLDLSKMDSQSLELREEPLMLYPFLLRVITSYTPLAHHRGINLSLRFNCPVDTTIQVDSGKWEKIINNLLGNALKFTNNGGKVELSALKNGEKIIIEVKDDGPGIDPEDLPFVFDRFYQGKKGTKSLHGGTGIGLALAKEYARICSAELFVVNGQEKGTTFRFQAAPTFLPPEEKQTEIQFTLPYKPVVFPRIATPGSDKPTVLIVEDDADMMQFISSILEEDYRLLTTDNGKSALELLKLHSADLILSDYMMPEIDGLQLLKAVRQRSAYIPFVLLTARVEAADRLEALQFGVDDYLTKPFSPDELKARLVNLISRQKSRKAFLLENESSPEVENLSFDQKWLQLLQDAVYDNLANPLFSVEMLATLLHTTERTLRNKIKSAVGITPIEYISEARLQKARQLLEARVHSTVAEVCFAVGFETPKYFTKLFKERFGKLPSEFLEH